jgi:predicted dehydrogenase
MDNSNELPWRFDAQKSGGGLIMDVGCHVVDRLDYLFGPLSGVSGTALNRNSPDQDVEDYVHLKAEIGPCSWARCVNSAGAKVECIWDFSPSDDTDECDELVVTGTDGYLRMAAMSPSLPVQVFNHENDLLQELTFEAPEHTAQALIQTITDELRGVGNAWCPSRADNAVRTSKVLDAALERYYGGRSDEFWLRPETWPRGKEP